MKYSENRKQILQKFDKESYMATVNFNLKLFGKGLRKIHRKINRTYIRKLIVKYYQSKINMAGV